MSKFSDKVWSNWVDFLVEDIECLTREEISDELKLPGLTDVVEKTKVKIQEELKKLAIRIAYRRGICRICGGPDHPKRTSSGGIDPFVLNYGEEYAHQSCIDKKNLEGIQENNLILCGCGKPGRERIDHGLVAGIHCDGCWGILTREGHSRSW